VELGRPAADLHGAPPLLAAAHDPVVAPGRRLLLDGGLVELVRGHAGAGGPRLGGRPAVLGRAERLIAGGPRLDPGLGLGLGRVGERLVAGPQLVVPFAGAERLVPARELLLAWRDLGERLVVAGLDHDRPATVARVTARDVPVRAALEAPPRHPVEELLADAPVGHLTAPPPGRARLLAVVIVKSPAPGLVFRHFRPLQRLTGLAAGLATKSAATPSVTSERRLAPTQWVPRFPSGFGNSADLARG
jgi:hypothetical protein